MNDLDIEDIYLLTPLQEGILFHALAHPTSGEYIVRSSWTLEAVDPAALRRAFESLVARHPVLRTGFHWEGLDRPIQVVVRDAALPFEQRDLSGFTAEAQQETIAALLRELGGQGLALDRAPLMRVILADLGGGRHQLVFCWHHLLLDGWSAALVVAELLAHYQAEVDQRAVALPWSRPFRDYVVHLGERDLVHAEASWRAQLAGFRATTPLPFDGEGEIGVDPNDPAARIERIVPRELREHLETFVRRERITLSTLVSAAWGLVLARHAASHDVVFGATVSGRPPELDGSDRMIGLFINTVPMRVTLDDESVGSFLRRLALQQAEQRDLEHTPLIKVKDWSELPRESPLFESLFVFENYPVDDLAARGDGALEVRAVEQIERTNYPLTLMVVPQGEITLAALFDRRRFSSIAIERLLGHLVTALEQLSADPARHLGEVRLQSDAASHDERSQWNLPTGPLPATSLVAAFAEQVRQRPHSIAIRGGGQAIAYADLDIQANRLAHVLLARRIGRESRVAVLLGRSVEQVIACLAIVKAGAVYVPLDPTQPVDRLRMLVDDTESALLLGRGQPPAELQTAVACLDLDALAAELVAAATTAPVIDSDPDQLVYVMYTSGSTGRPKGIAIPQRGVLRLVLDAGYVQITPNDVVSHASNVAFDAATFEVWGALLSGATLTVLPHGVTLSPDDLAAAIAAERITVMMLTTSVFNRLGLDAPEIFAGLRYLIVGGEALDPRAARRLLDTGLAVELVNGYGPTEVTTFSTAHSIAGLAAAARSVPIGRPIARTQAYVLDDDMAPVACGVPGELWLGGDGLARGYLGRASLTADRFRPSRFLDGARLYRTGDRVRRRATGEIEFIGRTDTQVKLRGFRIELGEVEAALVEHPAVGFAVAQIREDIPGERRLVAYVSPRARKRLDADALRCELARRLPDYMVPSQIVVCETLPTNAHGKLDHGALPVPPTQTNAAQAATLPRTAREVALAEVFQRVLHVDLVGIDDSFFSLGGDSITCIQLISRAREVGLGISARDVFEHPTIRELAKVARLRPRSTGVDDEVVGRAPLSPPQRWFLAQRRAEPQHFNLSFLFEVPPRLDLDALRTVGKALLGHHDQLRARFVDSDSGTVQEIDTVGDPSVESLDLSALPVDQRVAAIRDHSERIQRSLDLARGPLVRFARFQLDRSAVRVLVVAHHLVVDMVSWRILVEDLETATAQVLAGEAIALPPKTTSFLRFSERLAAYSATDRGRMATSVITEQQWSAVGLLPRDGNGPNTVGSLKRHRAVLTAAETRTLLAGAPQQFGCDANELLMTALACAMAETSGSDHVALLLEHHGREEVFEELDVTRTVGWFTSMIPLVLPVVDAADPRASVVGVRDAARSIPDRGFGYGLTSFAQPTPEVSWNYLGQLGSLVDSSGGWRAAPEDAAGDGESPAAIRSELLSVVGAVVGDCFEVVVGYSDRCHHDQTVVALTDRFLVALSRLLAGVTVKTAAPALCDLRSDEDIARSVAAPWSLLRPEDRTRIPDDAEDAYPLASAQQTMVDKSLAVARAAYQEFFSYHLPLSFDEARLQRALLLLSRRHPALRTVILVEEGKSTLQVVLRDLGVPLRVEDLAGLELEEQARRLLVDAAEERKQIFEPGKVLWRVAAHRRGPGSFQLTLSFHHAIIDGWSFATFLSELLEAYTAADLASLESAAADPAAPSYRVFVALEQAAAASTRAAPFWSTFLADAPVDALPRGLRPEDARVDGRAATKRFHLRALEPALVAPLVTLGRRLGVPLKSVFAAAHVKLFSVACGAHDLVTGLVTHGRPELPGSLGAVGCFLNFVPLRVTLPDGDWHALIATVASAERTLHRFRRFPLAQIERVAGRTPLYQTGFNFVQFHVLGEAQQRLEMLDAVEGNPDAEVEEPLWMDVSFISAEVGATLRVEFDPTVLCREQAQALGDCYADALRTMGSEPTADHYQWCPVLSQLIPER